MAGTFGKARPNRFLNLFASAAAKCSSSSATACLRSSRSKRRIGRKLAAERSTPIGLYTLDKLEEWEKRLLKRSRRLRKMGTKKRHHLRLLNKKLSYSIDSFEDLFSDKRFAKQKIALKHLRKAQRLLGQLNDGVRGQALAAELEESGVQTPLQFLRPKQEKRLLKRASQAYRKLNRL